MEDVQVGTVRCLNRNNKALIVGDSVVSRAVVPDGQVFQIFVGDVGVIGVLWVSEYLLLLLLEVFDQIIELVLYLRQLFFVFDHFKISVAELGIHIFQRVCSRVATAENTRFLGEIILFFHLLLRLFLIPSASFN